MKLKKSKKLKDNGPATWNSSQRFSGRKSIVLSLGSAAFVAIAEKELPKRSKTVTSFNSFNSRNIK